MSDLMARLDKLKQKIQIEDFLFGKGLSNEVNIWIFCYEPVEEMVIKNFISTLLTDLSITCFIHHFDLYKVFLDICRDKKILNAIPNMEDKKGKKYLLKQMNSIATDTAFINKMNFNPQIIGKDVLVL